MSGEDVRLASECGRLAALAEEEAGQVGGSYGDRLLRYAAWVRKQQASLESGGKVPSPVLAFDHQGFLDALREQTPVARAAGDLDATLRAAGRLIF